MGAVGVIVSDIVTVLNGHYLQNKRSKMRNAIITMIVVLLLAAGASAYPDKDFYSDGNIMPGEHWNNVRIYNDDTIVDMLGGGVDSVGSYDRSTFNLVDGYINTLVAWESGTLNVSGGYVYTLDAMGQSTVSFSGLANGVSFGVEDSATLNVTGGSTIGIWAYNSGTLNLRGGVVSDLVVGRDQSIINVHGFGLGKTDTGGIYGYGQIYGAWWDETPFTISLGTAETYSHVNLVPEPGSIILLVFGSFLLRQRR